ncbi:uncharacterized protein LODBEIA_P07740 [Lodderomyces beijingensis]|uniref:Uncharacterized protein n=1 Tax=Lodderomyces beijingensis TaxID=1775926 RepID=A0ABP0ZEF7_9ASCO
MAAQQSNNNANNAASTVKADAAKDNWVRKVRGGYASGGCTIV